MPAMAQQSFAGCLTAVLRRTLHNGEGRGLTEGTEVYVVGRRGKRDLVVMTKVPVDGWIRSAIVDEMDVRFNGA